MGSSCSATSSFIPEQSTSNIKCYDIQQSSVPAPFQEGQNSTDILLSKRANENIENLIPVTDLKITNDSLNVQTDSKLTVRNIPTKSKSLLGSGTQLVNNVYIIRVC